nr:molybdopterin dinucleotide binding domain-containing protein [Bacillota bacterium]
FSNTERRVQKIRKAVDAPEGVLPDWEILAGLLRRLGVPVEYDSAEDIFNEMRKVTPSYAGITYGRIEELGSLQWPCLDEEHPGTPVLHTAKFTRGEHALFKPAEYKEPAEQTDSEYNFTFTTGRILFHYHTRTMTGKSDGLNRIAGKSFVEIHPRDAAKYNIKDGEKVTVASRRGQVSIDARVTPDVKEGVLFMPFHFADGPANLLTNSAIDPTAKIPEYKVCAAKIVK